MSISVRTRNLSLRVLSNYFFFYLKSLLGLALVHLDDAVREGVGSAVKSCLHAFERLIRLEELPNLNTDKNRSDRKKSRESVRKVPKLAPGLEDK